MQRQSTKEEKKDRENIRLQPKAPAANRPIRNGDAGVSNRRSLRDITNVSRQGSSGSVLSSRTSAEPIESAFEQIQITERSAAVAPEPTHQRTSRHPRRDPDNIDANDASNPLAATDYVEDMYGYFIEKEALSQVDSGYMSRQSHINERMRAILIDWLVEVHLKFKLVPETLYLTVIIIDRFLEQRDVTRSKLQLVGVTALLLASKYEEIYPPELRDLVYITDRAYTKEEILDMESNILQALQFRITTPSIHCFLVRYLKAAHADRRMVQLGSFLCERILQEHVMLKYTPSIIASAAVLITRRNLNRHPWSPTLERYTGYYENDGPLQNCVKDFCAILGARSSLQAVQRKYSSNRYGGVSNITLDVNQR